MSGKLTAFSLDSESKTAGNATKVSKHSKSGMYQVLSLDGSID
jgi:hypothetical protein